MLPFASVVTAGACVALALAVATPQPAPDADYAPRVDRMLSAAWLADLYPLTRDPDITDEGYQAALATALRCARLAPDRRAAWDLALLLADQVEVGSPEQARVARRESLEALARLDPADDVIRLARLADAIDAHPTADARVRAYESALSEKHRSSIGSPCAARLAYQLASLESRIGNPELFARWLAESVKTDPAFPAAAQAAAGFFRMRVSDPAADVELLSGAIEANPRDVATWSALVTVLLDGAAFAGAERATRMAIAVAEAERRMETVYSLTGDLATALWGNGQVEAAARELELRMARLTDDFRRMISLIDPTITNERLNREFPPIPTTLSIAMLGLAKRQGDQARVEQLAERALRGSDAEIRRAKDANASPRRLAEYDIQKIAVTLLFGKDVSTVRALIDSTSKAEALGDKGKARFEGMLLWRQGKAAEALAALEPIRAEDAMAQYAYASVLVDLKRQSDAANEFRALAQGFPGTSIGLLALDRLAETLGQKSLSTAQLSPEIAQRSKSMEESLQRHLPRSVDDLIEHPMRALTVEVSASSTTIRPYEPLDLRVRLRNSSRLPMAIGADAPISGKVTLRTAAPRPGSATAAELEPQPILIDRRLRLDPGQEIEVNVEAALTAVGLLLNFEPLDPHLVNIAVVSNPATATGGSAPGFMGTVTSAPPVQFTGVLVTKQWIEESRQVIKAAGSIEAVTRLALMAHAAADPERHPEPLRPLLKESWADIVAAWKALPERAQAWVIAVLPKETPDLAPLLEAARASTSPSVLRSWAITRITDPKDAMLDVCRRSGDAELAELADSISWMAERRAARAVEEMGIEAEKATVDAGARGRAAVTGFVLRRLAQLPAVLLATFLVAFALAWVVPGSPFDDAEGRRPSDEVREAMRAQYRLDDPVGFLADYLGKASGVSWALGRAPRPFDLGPSLRHPDRSVNEIIADGLPISATIGVSAILLALAVGSVAGLVGALRPGSAGDAATQLLAVVGISVPVFVSGSVLLIVFAAKLRWLPVGGWEGIRSLVLPAVALSLVPAAYIARLMRSSMLEQMSADYMRTARAKGLSRRDAALRHAVRNAFRPVLSYLGPATAFAVTGSFVVEKVFAVPGIGQHFVNAVLSKDITLLLGVVLVLSALVTLLNLAVDLLYAWLDPRITVGAG